MGELPKANKLFGLEHRHLYAQPHHRVRLPAHSLHQHRVNARKIGEACERTGDGRMRKWTGDDQERMRRYAKQSTTQERRKRPDQKRVGKVGKKEQEGRGA